MLLNRKKLNLKVKEDIELVESSPQPLKPREKSIVKRSKNVKPADREGTQKTTAALGATQQVLLMIDGLSKLGLTSVLLIVNLIVFTMGVIALLHGFEGHILSSQDLLPSFLAPIQNLLPNGGNIFFFDIDSWMCFLFALLTVPLLALSMISNLPPIACVLGHNRQAFEVSYWLFKVQKKFLKGQARPSAFLVDLAFLAGKSAELETLQKSIADSSKWSWNLRGFSLFPDLMAGFLEKAGRNADAKDWLNAARISHFGSCAIMFVRSSACAILLVMAIATWHFFSAYTLSSTLNKNGFSTEFEKYSSITRQILHVPEPFATELETILLTKNYIFSTASLETMPPFVYQRLWSNIRFFETDIRRLKESGSNYEELARFKHDHKFLGHLYHVVAQKHANAKEYEQSLAFYKKSLATLTVAGDNTASLQGIYAAETLYKLKRYNEAREYFEQYIEEPVDAFDFSAPDTQIKLARCYYQLKQYTDAKRLLQSTVKWTNLPLDPNNSFSRTTQSYRDRVSGDMFELLYNIATAENDTELADKYIWQSWLKTSGNVKDAPELIPERAQWLVNHCLKAGDTSRLKQVCDTALNYDASNQIFLDRDQVKHFYTVYRDALVDEHSDAEVAKLDKLYNQLAINRGF